MREMVKLLEVGHRRQAARVHRQLHFELYRRAGSPWLERLAELLWDNGDRHLTYSPALRPSMAEFGREHQIIVDAVAGGQPEIAAAAVTEHLANAARLLSDFLQIQGKHRDSANPAARPSSADGVTPRG